jgi:phage repressor protein C with HTH and peptisase S24 domain
MFPVYKDQDFVVSSSFFRIKKNNVIVIKTENFGLIIKRISLIKDGKVFLTGDNKNNISSTCDYGHCISQVLGRVIIKFSLPKYIFYIIKKYGLNKN